MAPIDIFCPFNNQGFCKQFLQQTHYFQQQALSGIESISGCTFNFVIGFEENSLQLKRNAVKWMKANPMRSTFWKHF